MDMENLMPNARGCSLDHSLTVKDVKRSKVELIAGGKTKPAVSLTPFADRGSIAYVRLKLTGVGGSWLVPARCIAHEARCGTDARLHSPLQQHHWHTKRVWQAPAAAVSGYTLHPIIPKCTSKQSTDLTPSKQCTSLDYPGAHTNSPPPRPASTPTPTPTPTPPPLPLLPLLRHTSLIPPLSRLLRPDRLGVEIRPQPLSRKPPHTLFELFNACTTRTQVPGVCQIPLDFDGTGTCGADAVFVADEREGVVVARVGHDGGWAREAELVSGRTGAGGAWCGCLVFAVCMSASCLGSSSFP